MNEFNITITELKDNEIMLGYMNALIGFFFIASLLLACK